MTTRLPFPKEKVDALVAAVTDLVLWAIENGAADRPVPSPDPEPPAARARNPRLVGYVTPHDVKEQLQCSLSHAYTLLRKATPGGRKPGTIVRVRLDVWERFCAERFGDASKATAPVPLPQVARRAPRPKHEPHDTGEQPRNVRLVYPRTKARAQSAALPPPARPSKPNAAREDLLDIAPLRHVVPRGRRR